MPQVFYNNVVGFLSGSHAADATTMSLLAGHNFPDPGADYYLATFALLDASARETAWEIVRVTDVSGDTLTVVRGQEGTTGLVWAGGSRIEVRLTAGATESKANLGTAAYTATTAYATAAQGVTNGNSHDHAGGDGGQIAYSGLSGLPTLGNAAAKDVGTGSTQVAAGDHAHSGVYQAADSELTALAGLAVTDSNFIVGNGTTWVAESGATARTSLGLGTAAMAASTDFAPATGSSVYAPLASPALTGNPTAPTASQGDNDTSIATTAFVNAEIAAEVAGIGGRCTISATAPVSPLVSDLWWNSGTGQLAVYYNDGDTSQWVACLGGPGATGSPGTNGTTEFSFSIPAALVVATGTMRWYLDRSYTIQNIIATVGTAPTGASVIFDVNKNGTTIFTTQGNRPTIVASGFSDLTSTPDVTSLVSGDYLTVDVDQVGSTLAGGQAVVRIKVL